MKDLEFMKSLYRSFNARNSGEVLKHMCPDVKWPNGWEGGYVAGTEAVGNYWKRQWAEIDPKVEPLEAKSLEDGRVSVLVHQVVKDLAGKVLMDIGLKHIYSFDGALISRMEIEEAPSAAL